MTETIACATAKEDGGGGPHIVRLPKKLLSLILTYLKMIIFIPYLLIYLTIVLVFYNIINNYALFALISISNFRQIKKTKLYDIKN